MKSILLPICIVAVLVAAGCGSEPTPPPAPPPAPNPIIGIWHTAVPKGGITLTLNADGTAEQSIDDPTGYQRLSGKYTAENDSLTTTFDRGTKNGVAVTTPPPPQTFHYTVSMTRLTLGTDKGDAIYERVEP